MQKNRYFLITMIALAATTKLQGAAELLQQDELDWYLKFFNEDYGTLNPQESAGAVAHLRYVKKLPQNQLQQLFNYLQQKMDHDKRPDDILDVVPLADALAESLREARARRRAAQPAPSVDLASLTRRLQQLEQKFKNLKVQFNTANLQKAS